jgi:hypothetical protein
VSWTSEGEPVWLADRRLALFKAYVKAWSIAAQRVNVLSGFTKCGIFPFNPQRVIENDLVADTTTESVVPGDDIEEMKCALVTRPAVLAHLKGKSNKIGGRCHDCRDLTPITQYARLNAERHPEGRLLGGPGPHFYDITPNRDVLVHEEEKQRWHYLYMPRSDPDRLWNAVLHMQCHIPRLSGTVIICRDLNEVKRHSDYCSRNGHDHSIFYMLRRKKRADEISEDASDSAGDDCDDPDGHTHSETLDPIAPWLAFQDGAVDLCLTTAASIRSIHSVRRVLVVYTVCPTPGVFSSTYMDSNNILICGPASTVEQGRQPLPGTFTDVFLS